MSRVALIALLVLELVGVPFAIGMSIIPADRTQPPVRLSGVLSNPNVDD